MTGTASIQPKGSEDKLPLKDGTPIPIGAIVMAPGPSPAVLTFPNGVKLTLQPGSKLMRVQGGFDLMEGRAEFDRDETGAATDIMFCLAFSFYPIGTRFEIAREPGSKVVTATCHKGLVRIRRTEDDSEAIELLASETITLVGSAEGIRYN